MRNSTQLVFCHPNVVPEEITLALGISPSESSWCEPRYDAEGSPITSPLGTWKLELPSNDTSSIEEQISAWLNLLEPKSTAFDKLKLLGYSPYLDCKAEPRSLSVCIEPDLLLRLGKLHIALSVWLYEQV